MRNFLGIAISFFVGIIIGGGFLQLGLIGSFILAAIAYTVYNAIFTKEMAFPIVLWGVIAACAIFCWLMF